MVDVMLVSEVALDYKKRSHLKFILDEEERRIAKQVQRDVDLIQAIAKTGYIVSDRGRKPEAGQQFYEGLFQVMGRRRRP